MGFLVQRYWALTFSAFLLLVLALAVALALPGLGWAATPVPPPPTQNIYVYDQANLIDPAQREQMLAIGEKINAATKAQVVVATVDTIGQDPIEDYALELFRQWGIGDRQKNNGVLLLIVKDRMLSGQSGKVRIEVGYGLEGAIPDGKAGRILDEYVLPAWQSGKYSDGIYQGYLALAGEVAKEYNLDISADPQLQSLKDYPVESNGLDGFPWGILVFFVFVIAYSLTAIRRRKQGYPGGKSGPFWGGGFPSGFPGGGFGSGGFGGFGSGGFGGGSSGGGGASR